MLEILPSGTNDLDLSVKGERELLLEIGPSGLSMELDIAADSHLVLQLVALNKESGSLPLKGNFTVHQGGELNITLIDFSQADTKVDFAGRLYKGGRFTCHLACSASKDAKKLFDIKIGHLEENSFSSVKMFGVISDQANLTFLGTSDIAKGAKKSVTRQEGRIADLSKGGKGEVSPILKIGEDDVKASHGAALGKVPDEALFYLMSRGLTRDEAMKLITLGYLKPIVQEITSQGEKEKLLGYLGEGE
jgi:Fe-S cluster assembly protein SufD